MGEGLRFGILFGETLRSMSRGGAFGGRDGADSRVA